MSEEQKTEVALLKLEIDFLKTKITSIENDVRDKFDRLEAKLDQALNAIQKAQNGKPSWAVAIIITALSSITVSLIVYSVTR